MKHLTVEQRYEIWAMMQQGLQQKEIALAIGKDKSIPTATLQNGWSSF